MSWQDNRKMTPAQYAAAIKTLNLNKAQAGRFVGVSERTAHRYHDGHAAIPVATVLLLRSMIEHGEKPVVPGWRQRGRTRKA